MLYAVSILFVTLLVILGHYTKDYTEWNDTFEVRIHFLVTWLYCGMS